MGPKRSPEDPIGAHGAQKLRSRPGSRVHQLLGPPLEGTGKLTVERLGFALPEDLMRFLSSHNGATLFRGALNLRSLEQLTPASIQYPKLILFAEGPRTDDLWAFACNRDGSYIFGRWKEDNFTPLHSTFSSWLQATLYILDEPTTGLHIDDVRRLLEVLHRIVDDGGTMVIIEHNLEVIKSADWVIDLGPEGGIHGGEVVVTGTPEQVMACEASHTGRALWPVLSNQIFEGKRSKTSSSKNLVIPLQQPLWKSGLMADQRR